MPASVKSIRGPVVGKDGETTRIEAVITGVPRAGRDDAYQFPAAQDKATNKVSKCEAPEEKSPPLRSAAQPDTTESRRITATIPPRSEADCGIVFFGSYKVEGGQVHVADQDGHSLGSLPINPGDDVESVARKLLRDKLGGNFSDFYGTIRLPKLSIH